MKHLNFLSKTRWLLVPLMLITLGIGQMWGAVAYGTYVEATALESGAHYILTGVKNSTTYCASNASNANNRKTVSTTVSSGKITVASNSTIMTFTLGGSSDAWTFATDNYAGSAGYLKATSSSSNYLGVNNSLDDNARWTIGSFSNGTATMVANGTNSRKKVRFNPNGNNDAIIAAYATNTSTGTDVKFYRKAVQGVSGNPTYGTVSVAGDVITATPGSGYRVSTSNPYTISPTGKATVSQSGNVFTLTNVSALVTLTVNFEEDVQSFDITAQSNNTTYGTVSKSGSIITGSPKANCRYASPAYSVSPANSATVNQNGNEFIVTPSANTTVTINFEPIPTHSIHFSTGGLVNIADATEIQEGTIYNISQTPAASLTEHCEYGTFVGWTTASTIANPSVKPTIITSYEMGNADVTLYAVYKKIEGDLSEVTINFGYGDWGKTAQFSGTDFDDLSQEVEGVTVTDVRNTGSLYANSTSTRFYKANELTFASDENITTIVFTVSSYQTDITANVGTCTATSTEFSWEGTAKSVTFTRPSNASSYAQFSSAKVIVGNGTTTYSLDANCCSPLGQINGSVSMTQTTAALEWADLANVSSWAIQYKEHGAQNWNTWNGAQATNNNKRSVTITNLSCGTAYDFKIAATAAPGYCDAEQVIENQSTSKWNISYTLTNTVEKTAGPETGANACGEISASFSKNESYTFPDEITVTIGGVEASPSTDYDWDANEGELLIDAAKVTGNVVITIAGVAPANPVVTPSPVALSFDQVKKGADVPAAQDIAITGQNLTAALTVESSNTSLYVVSLKSGSLTPDGNKDASPVITVTPQAGITSTAGDKNATITISGGGLSEDVVVNVTFNVQETYTVNWYVNGNPTPARTQTDIVGTDLTEIPSDFSAATDCSDKTFMGWTETANYSDENDAPDDLITSTEGMKITAANKNYYAVFADKDGEDSNSWDLVTNVSSLQANDIITFTSTCEYTYSKQTYKDTVAYAGKSGDLGAVVPIGITNNKIRTVKEGSIGEIKLEEGSTDGTWKLYDLTDKYITEGDKKITYAETSGDVSISITSGAATVKFGTSSYSLQYNPNNNAGTYSSARMAFYSSTQKGIQIYKKTVTEAEYSNYVVVCPHVARVTLSAAEVSNGSISFAKNEAAITSIVTAGEDPVTVDVVAEPTTGYALTDVALSGVAGASYTEGVITIPANAEGTLVATATFGVADYVVTLEQSPAAGATLNGGKNDAHYAETVNISTNVPDGYLFAGWTPASLFADADAAKAASTSFTMPNNDVTVTANFIAVHNVAWAIENTPSSGTSDFVYVKGIVTDITEIETTQYYNATYYISDLDENGEAVNSFEVFHGKNVGNTNFTNANQLTIGDEVIVYGKLKTYSTVKEFDGGNYIITNGRTAAELSSIVVSAPDASQVKTEYFTGETFLYAGLNARAIYNTSYQKDVTAAATFKANGSETLTVTANATVNVTATWSETTSADYPVTISVTTKVLQPELTLSESALTGYLGQALPKPTTITAHFIDNTVPSTENVTLQAVIDENDTYDASLTTDQTIPVKYTFGPNTATASYTVTLSSIVNTLGMAYSVAQAKEIIDIDKEDGNDLDLELAANKVYVTGIVTSKSGSDPYTIQIKDNAADEAFLELYKCTFGSDVTGVQVGDVVKAYGNLKWFASLSKYELDEGGRVVAVARTPEFGIDDVAEMEVNITADLAEADLTIERGGSEGAITFSCSDPAVTIVGNKLHAAAEGDATVTATMAANGEGAMSYGEATTTFNVHVIAERTRYAVNFDANGGSGDAPVVANQLPGVPVDLPANTFTKTDMRFTGWVVTNNSTSEVIAQEDGHFTMPEAAVTLTAQWEAKTYCALTLRINGVDQAPFNVERLEANDLSGHNPETTNGYDFYGWAVLDSDVEEDVTEAITILPNHIFTPTADEASKTLYAVFTKAESGDNKHYVLDYADDHLADVSFSYNEAADVTATDGSEWVIKASKQQSMQINTGKDAYIQVPNCPADIVSIVLSCRTGATAAAAFSTTSDGDAIVTATGSTTQTLNFSEVHVSAGYIIPYDGNCQITHIDVEYSGNFAYYTTRPVVRYTVTYDANGGTNAPAAAKTDVNGKVTVTSETPTAPEDKVFYCWNENEDGTGAIYWAGDTVAVSDADVTIYATWRDLPTTEAIATIGGKFIINNLGDTAVFSRGNLQHQLSTNTWRTAPNQYEWAGEAANEQMGNPNYNGWVDLFSWSIGEENNYGATSAYHPSLYFNKEFVDWGTLFTGDWSTLSINEWTYMLYDRPNANNLWGMAMIGDTLGMVLLPGDWTAPSGVTFVPGYKPETDMWDEEDQLDPLHLDIDRWRLNPEKMLNNKFTEEQWAILEDAGAVFCPYAGRRSGGYGNHTNMAGATVGYEYNYTYWENYYGAYWTSTVRNAAEGKVYWLPTICGGCDSNHENWGRGSHGWWENGRYGHSVRLVTRIPRKYTVTYDANGATSGSVPVNGKTYQDGDTVHVAAKGDLAREGYAFAGWKFKGTTYKAGDTYTISDVRYYENIVFEAQWNAPSEYVLVTKHTQLAAGDQIIIAAAGNYDYAMGTQNSGNYRNRVEIAKTEDKKRICLVEEPVVFTLGVSSNYFTFYKEGEGFLCATSSSSNNIGTEAELDNNGKWEISVSTDANGVVKASVVAQGDKTRNTLQYNSGATRFSCYSSASQQAVALYKIPGNVDVDNKNIGTEDIAQNSTVTLDNGTMTVNESKELDDLTLGLHAVVDVQENKTLETKDLTIKSTAGESTQMTGVVENVTYSNFYLEINFYKSAETLDETTANQWYMISAPFDVALNGGFFQTNGTPMVFGQDFDLFEYDGNKRATTGVTGWARPQGVMHGGHACLIGFNEGQSTTIRLKAATTQLANPTSITLNEYTGESTANSNWNGVANPTMYHINFSTDVQTYDNDARGYQTYSYDENSFVVGRAFFVHGTGTVDLSAATHPVYAPRREAAEKKYSYCVRLASENSNWANQMYVRASEEASASYEAGHDLETMNGTTGINALLWTNNYGMRLAIEEAPLVNDQASYELGLYAPKNGEYRIEVASPKEDADLYLTREGAIIWNLSESAYTIDLNKGTTTGYGLLLKAKMPQTPTGIEQSVVSGQPSDVQKVIIDENVFILRGGQMYDVTGKMVK